MIFVTPGSFSRARAAETRATKKLLVSTECCRIVILDATCVVSNDFRELFGESEEFKSGISGIVVHRWSWSLKKFALLCDIDYFYFYLILSLAQVATRANWVRRKEGNQLVKHKDTGLYLQLYNERPQEIQEVSLRKQYRVSKKNNKENFTTTWYADWNYMWKTQGIVSMKCKMK